MFNIPTFAVDTVLQWNQATCTWAQWNHTRLSRNWSHSEGISSHVVHPRCRHTGQMNDLGFSCNRRKMLCVFIELLKVGCHSKQYWIFLGALVLHFWPIVGELTEWQKVKPQIIDHYLVLLVLEFLTVYWVTDIIQ